VIPGKVEGEEMRLNGRGKIVIRAGVRTVIAGIALVQSLSPAAPALPTSIQSAFQRTYPGATITSATEERDSGRNAFRVDFMDKGHRKRVLYDQAAAVIEIGEQVEEKDLPQPVAAAMHSHPRAIFVAGMRVTRGKDVRYDLTLRGSRKTAMVVKSDGTVLSFK
jgi:hypothetical protein